MTAPVSSYGINPFSAGVSSTPKGAAVPSQKVSSFQGSSSSSPAFSSSEGVTLSELGVSSGGAPFPSPQSPKSLDARFVRVNDPESRHTVCMVVSDPNTGLERTIPDNVVTMNYTSTQALLSGSSDKK